MKRTNTITRGAGRATRAPGRGFLRSKGAAVATVALAWRVAWWVWQPAAGAVVFYSTGDPTHNVVGNAGTPAVAQYVGGWGITGGATWYSGMPIGAFYFITAKHLLGLHDADVGGTFNIGGVNYTATAHWDDPSSDLSIWKVDHSFPANEIASLYTGSGEVGQNLLVLGRGTQRGAEVNVPNASPSALRGWEDGTLDHQLRWGANVVSGFANYGSASSTLLYAHFDAAGVTDEATLTAGDSGGGVFINGKLAGVNYAVDGPFENPSAANPLRAFSASIFDAGGLDVYNGSGYTSIPDQAENIPSSFYASRISSEIGWIDSVIPEPSAYGLVGGLGLAAYAVWKRRHRGARR